MNIISSLAKQKRICIIVFSIYILIVLKLTIFRFNFHYEERQLNLTLFTALINIYRCMGIGEFMLQFFGNIGWFIPLGFLWPIIVKRRSFLITTVIGCLFSLSIETIQYVSYKGVAELDDLILNTLGTAIGYYLFKILCKRDQHIDLNNSTVCKKSKENF